MFKSFVNRILHGGMLGVVSLEAGGGAGAGSGAGSGGSGAGAGTGSGAAAPIVLTGDSLVDFGDGKPVKWSEATHSDNGRWVSRDRWDRGVQFLQGEAGKLQKKWDEYHAGTGARPNKPEPNAGGNNGGGRRDPLANIRDMPVVDGRALEALYNDLQQQGLAPIAQVIAQMANEIKTLKGSVGSLGKGMGSISERDQQTEFEGFITKSYNDLGALKGLPEGVALDAQDPHLRELAKDLYLSHEIDSWKPGEFNRQLKARVEANIAMVRALDKKAVEVAQSKKRVWMNPSRGGGNPQGNTPYKFQRGAEVARQFFGGTTAEGT